MPINLDEIKVITFPALFVRALSYDYEYKKITWKDLYVSLFIENTDIYNEMKVTLISLGLEMDEIISYKKTHDITSSTEVIFMVEEEDSGRRVLTHSDTREQTIVPKTSSIKSALSKMGFTQKINKF